MITVWLYVDMLCCLETMKAGTLTCYGNCDILIHLNMTPG